jgi:uncharacterized membrane protein
VNLFIATISQKIWFPYVPLEMAAINKAPAIIFFLETLFLAVISRGT